MASFPTSSHEEIAQLLAQRYGKEALDAQPIDFIGNTLTQHMLEHRSVRAFAPTALPEGLVQTLVAAAQSGSSSSNLQVWSVVAIEDPAHKDELATWANNQNFVRQAPLFLIWLADWSRNLAVADVPEGVALDGADYLESVVLASVDTAIAAQNAALAAESLGLGVVYAGAIRSHIRAIAENLKLPAHVFPVFGQAIGYPSQPALSQIRPRLPQTAVLHREYYDGSATQEAAQVYDRALDDFWRKQSIDHPVWTQHLATRLGNSSLKGDARFELTQVLKDLGFLLR